MKQNNDFKDKRVLNLGCGFGWHCQYAIEQGAEAVTGVDISEKMLTVAKEKTDTRIRYFRMPIEDIVFGENSFDVIISSLSFHYIESFEQIVAKVSGCLIPNGDFRTFTSYREWTMSFADP